MADKMKVSGIAIKEGVSRNGIMYTAKELAKFTPTLSGRPIIKDHAALTDNVIGKITESKSVDGREVSYSGWIKEDGTGIIDKIKDGRISEVSIGAMCGKLVKESEDSEYVIAKDMTAMELSTTPTPGVIGTSISQSIKNYEKESIEKEVSNYLVAHEAVKTFTQESHSRDAQASHEIINNEKEVKMESTQENKKTEDTKIVESQATMIAELQSKLSEATKAVDTMKESKRQEAISAYNKACESKKIAAKETSNMSIETIQVLLDTINSFEVKATETTAAKEMAQSKAQEAVTSSKVVEGIDGYVIEQSTLGGLTFYKNN